MKKSQISGLVLLTALLSLNVFAAGSGTLTFSQDKVKQDPTFHCDVSNDKGTFLSPTRIKFNIDDKGINFGTKGKEMDGISVEDTKKSYFYVTKDEGGDGTVHYSTNNQSDVICAIGDGGRANKYNN